MVICGPLVGGYTSLMRDWQAWNEEEDEPALAVLDAAAQMMVCVWGMQPGMMIRNSHGFATETHLHASDGDSQAFLILCESPGRRRFLRGVRTVLAAAVESRAG